MPREDTELITSLLESGCVDNIDVSAQETCRNQKLLLNEPLQHSLYISQVFYDSPQQIFITDCPHNYRIQQIAVL